MHCDGDGGMEGGREEEGEEGEGLKERKGEGEEGKGGGGRRGKGGGGRRREGEEGGVSLREDKRNKVGTDRVPGMLLGLLRSLLVRQNRQQ